MGQKRCNDRVGIFESPLGRPLSALRGNADSKLPKPPLVVSESAADVTLGANSAPNNVVRSITRHP